MAGTGKRTELHKRLKQVADSRKLPFTIQTKCIHGSGGGEEGEEGEGEETGQIMYETSIVHIGFDVARMSMQDKQVLRPILSKLGQGSQVVSGEQGHGSRIIVLYHAHLLSSESILLLQACLEQNEGDVSVWLTSEMPVPHRIRDWFIELPVSGLDRAFGKFVQKFPEQKSADWSDVFHAVLTKWLHSPPPTIGDIKEVKAFVYELLMRNFRWVEATHFLLDVIIKHDGMTVAQRKKCIEALAECEATGGGYTIPSYRIPIIWESLFIKIRSVLHSSRY